MKHAVPLICVWAVTACTTPDVSTPLAQARAEFTAFSSGIDAQLLRDAAAERSRQEQRAIAADRAVIGFVGDCDTTVARLEAPVLSNCNLVEYFDPRDDAGSASELVDFRTIMNGYLTSLEALAASQTAAQAHAQAEAIVAAFGMPDAARPAAFEQLGASVRERQTLISTSTRLLVNRLRVGALRRAMREADAILDADLEVIVAHLEPYDTALILAQEGLTTARQRLLDAEGQGNPVAFAAAVEGARAAHAAFQQAEASSPITNLLQFRQTHTRLFARTWSGADATEFVEVLEELRVLFDAMNEET
jgi:hypothetical protein